MGAVVSWVTLTGCQSSPGDAWDANGDRNTTIAAPDGGGNIDAQLGDLGDDISDDRRPGDDQIVVGEFIDWVVAGEDSHRYQMADIVPLGGQELAVGYLDSDRRLKYAYWDDNGRQGSAVWAADDVRWVRADTADPLERADPGCPPDGVARFSTMATERGTDVRTVRLDVHSNCGGHMTFVSHLIAEGVRPSSVTTGPDTTEPGQPALTIAFRDGPSRAGSSMCATESVETICAAASLCRQAAA
jgi:hypothetical protein